MSTREYSREYMRQKRLTPEGRAVTNAAQARYARTPRGRAKKNACMRRRWYVRNYGITIGERDILLLTQGDRCACCATDNPGKLGWNVHHSHRSGRVLAILCSSCNTGSGFLKDDPELLRRMAAINECDTVQDKPAFAG